MTNFTYSPLNYPVNANTPIKRVKFDKDPTTENWRNFNLGDEWLNTITHVWWKLFSIDGYVAIWKELGHLDFSSITVDASTPPGTNPVVPSASGNLIITGGQVASGTTANVIRTDSLAPNSFAIEIQRSAAAASPTIGLNGVSHYNSTYFSVDSDGFVDLLPANIPYYSLTPYIVGQVGDIHAQFTGDTGIQLAINAASAPANVIVKPGIYVTDLIHKAGVNVIAMPGASDTPTVIIVGKNTFTSSGSVTIANILLQTNADFCVVVSGASPSLLNLEGVLINCADNVGISYTSSGVLSGIIVSDSFANIGALGLHTFTSSGAGSLSFTNFTENNDFNSITPNTMSAGNLQMGSADFGTPIAISGTCSFNSREAFITCNPGPAALAITGTAQANLTTSGFSAGTSPAITIGAGCSCTLIASQVASNNTNAVGGTGTLSYNSITFTGVSSQFDPALTLSLAPSTPSNAPINYIWKSTGTNTSPTWQPDAGSGGVVQQVRTFTGSVITTTNSMGATFDNAPTNTAGVQLLSVSITPTSASSILVVEASLNYSAASSNAVQFGFFLGAAGTAFAAYLDSGFGSAGDYGCYRAYVTAGTTSPVTIAVRAGPLGSPGGAIFALNGESSGVHINGAAAFSDLMVTEFSV